MKVRVGVSARHVHLNREDLDILFGKDYELNKKKDLSQPGQFSSMEQVTLKGPKSVIENVRILGPIRNKTQVELAKTDCHKLGINPPVRNSGDLQGAHEITIIGPNGSIERNSAIIAARHIHATKEDAEKLGILNKEKVSLKISGPKAGIIENVYVRISDDYSLEVHLDTDEANAFLINSGDEEDLIIK